MAKIIIEFSDTYPEMRVEAVNTSEKSINEDGYSMIKNMASLLAFKGLDDKIKQGTTEFTLNLAEITDSLQIAAANDVLLDLAILYEQKALKQQ